MGEHLAFLRLHKNELRLALNATEDLLVNGARPPTDRGISKHLLAKVDRKVVERALARDALKNDAHQRARFIAGIVRLNPEISLLLRYLETLAEVADRREAAGAFALTVDRIDFEQVSNAQMAQLLSVITQTFEGHDRVQALFGLLASDSFARALDRALLSLAEELREIFAPLRAAFRVVVGGEPLPDEDDAERDLFARGMRMWLSAPDRVLRSYALDVRKRLAEFAIQDRVCSTPKSLLDSLPHHDDAYARLGLMRVEQLFQSKQDEDARALLSQIVQAHPNMARAARWLDALSWPRVGRIAIAPPVSGNGLKRAFWLDGACFVWARVLPPERAGQLALEAQLQESVPLPGVSPALAHGLAGDGTAFVAFAPGGRPFDPVWIQRLRLQDALFLALEGVHILRALAALGTALPDAAPQRFLFEHGSPHGLRLADFDGAAQKEPAACAIQHGPLAADFCRQILKGERGGPRPNLPAVLRERLRGTTPLLVLARLLAEQAARAHEA
jgi:hypothetical protein